MHANAVVKSPNQPLQSLLFLASNLFFFFSQPVGLVELAAEQRFLCRSEVERSGTER
jgi:hypothetical protein